jgi:UDP-N-acetylmuramoyl-tripeptide--D-alanyl-D-alanine ligase
MVSEIILINTAIIGLFSIQAVGQFLVWTYWLQVKEYRYDRFLVFFKSSDGKRELLLIPIGVKFLILIASLFIHPFFLLLYLAEVLIMAVFFTASFLSKKLRRPVFTQRVNKISLITLFLILSTLLFYYPNIRLIVLEACVLLGPFLGINITGFSVRKTKEKEKLAASEKLRKYRTFTIGITGSYGKTTTKDFLTQILGSKYPVLSTYKNQNTHFGILRRINNDLKRKHKFLVAEVGAYKRNEIKEISDILKPGMAFITGIEPQHLELFGSYENLKNAKFEMVEALESGGSAFFNASDENIEDLIEKSKKLKRDLEIYTYTVGGRGKFSASSVIKEINPEGIVFLISLDGDKKEIRTNIIAKSLIENLTGAILAARVLGVEWEKIIKTCANLNLPDGTLNVFKTVNGITVIDDSYNTSFSGFESALEVLNRVKAKRKIVATTGIIELGRESDAVHRRVGEYLDSVADLILLRNKEFEKPLRESISAENKLILIMDPKKMVEYLKDEIKKSDVVLIEGKLPFVTEYFKNI